MIINSTLGKIIKEGLASLGPAGGALTGQRLGSKFPSIGVVRGSLGGTVVGTVGTEAVKATLGHIPAIDSALKQAVMGERGDSESFIKRPSTPNHAFNPFQDQDQSRRLLTI